jgi:hypothetical protein
MLLVKAKQVTVRLDHVDRAVQPAVTPSGPIGSV